MNPPRKAISIECTVCRRGQREPCQSIHCRLRQAGTSLARIRAHCQQCAPNHRVEECTGRIIGTQAKALNVMYGIPVVDGKAECPLFLFRFGKNPNIVRKLSEDQKSVNVARLKSYRFQKKGTFSPDEGAEHQAGV